MACLDMSTYGINYHSTGHLTHSYEKWTAHQFRAKLVCPYQTKYCARKALDFE